MLLLLTTFMVFVESYYIGNSGCNDMIRIPDASSITLPKKHSSKYNRPWLNPKLKTRLYSSQTLAQNWRWLKSHKIQGINSTLAEVLEVLEENGCFLVGYGSGIKSVLLGTIKEQSLLKIGGEITCSSFKLHEICTNNFGPENCGTAPNTAKDKIIIGSFRTAKELNEFLIEPITLSEWDTMISTDRLKWDFTANECGLFDDYSRNMYLIDYTAQCQVDICQQSIKIPVQPSYWKKWTQNNLIKILKVYNLVADGFVVEQREYQFIIDFIKNNFNTGEFQQYFCVELYGGKFYPWISQTNKTKSQILNRSQCHFLTLDSRRTRLFKKVNQTLLEDFGELWSRNMTNSLIGMSLFEDTRKPRNPSMKKVIAVNYGSESENGRARLRNVLTEGRNSAVFNVGHTVSIKSQPLTISDPSPSTSITTATASKRSTETTTNNNAEKTYVPAVPSPQKPVKPCKEELSRIWNSWNSGTQNPSVKYYSHDEIPRVLATDY